MISQLSGRERERRKALAGAQLLTRLVAQSDERFRRTCDAIGRELTPCKRIKRYAVENDVGVSEAAFLACNFCCADALAVIGRADEARQTFASILSCRNWFGLLSGDVRSAPRRENYGVFCRRPIRWRGSSIPRQDCR